MSIEQFHKVFSAGTRLTDAWAACGTKLENPRNPPWAAWRPDGMLVITVWREQPGAGRWVQWHPGNAGFRFALRDPGSIAGESAARLQKLRSYNLSVRTALRSGKPIIVLVLNHRKNAQGQFLINQAGATEPVEAWSAWVGEVRDGGGLPYSVVQTRQYAHSPFEASA